jgi:hypothetical protein
MTRKQAVLRAIEELSRYKKNAEIVPVLQEIYNELPIMKWNKESILDSIQQYMNEHNNMFPPKKKFGYGELPAKTTVYKIFNVNSIEEFREKYFPESDDYASSPYKDYQKEDYVKAFVDSYNSINNGAYVKRNEFDHHRKNGTPCVRTMIILFECRTYKELLKKLNIQIKENVYSTSYTRDSNIEISKKNLEQLQKYIK